MNTLLTGIAIAGWNGFLCRYLRFGKIPGLIKTKELDLTILIIFEVHTLVKVKSTVLVM